MTRPPGGVRPARESDLLTLREIERAAGRPFAALGMDLVAGDGPPSVEVLREYAADGRAWVRTDEADRPVAYLLAEFVDGGAHLEQVSVHPDRAHQRLGQELLEHLTAWAREHRLPAITLMTYAELPWNGATTSSSSGRHRRQVPSPTPRSRWVAPARTPPGPTRHDRTAGKARPPAPSG